MFPLNTVLFPGMEVPLHIFEERYRAMMRHLLDLPEENRSFGSVAIREGYEVGEHGQQELHRIGCRLLLREAIRNPDGTFDIVADVTGRIRMTSLSVASDFPYAEVDPLPDQLSDLPETVVNRAVVLFAAYRQALHEVRGDPLPIELPGEPAELIWALADAAPMTFPDRQDILEAPDLGTRVALLTEHFRSEIELMRVLPSLPASRLARTGWHPN